MFDDKKEVEARKLGLEVVKYCASKTDKFDVIEAALTAALMSLCAAQRMTFEKYKELREGDIETYKELCETHQARKFNVPT